MRLNKKDYDYAVQCLKRYDYNKLKKNKNSIIVDRVLLIIDNDSRYIFEEEFRKKRNRWDIIDELNISERTYQRRRKDLIDKIHQEVAEKWRKNGEKII